MIIGAGCLSLSEDGALPTASGHTSAETRLPLFELAQLRNLKAQREFFNLHQLLRI